MLVIPLKIMAHLCSLRTYMYNCTPSLASVENPMLSKIFQNRYSQILTIAGATLAIFCFTAGSTHAATYTWDNGSTDAWWTTDANWAPDGTKPGAGAAGDVINFTGSGLLDGQAQPGADAVVTVGNVSWNNNFQWKMGTWNVVGSGITVDTGSTADAVWNSNGNTMTFDYTNFVLNNNLALTGGGRINIEPGSGGITGNKGIIVENGRLNFQGIHVQRSNMTFTGGIEIKANGIVSFGGGPGNYRNSDLGDGLITIHEGGQLQAHNSVLDQDFLFDINSTGTTTPFISGGDGSNWNASGEWTFDLTDAGNTIGDLWNIVGVGGAATYDTGFGIAGFTEDSGVWTGIANDAEYQFDQSTGALSVTAEVTVPEPSTFALAALSLIGLGWFGWRRRS